MHVRYSCNYCLFQFNYNINNENIFVILMKKKKKSIEKIIKSWKFYYNESLKTCEIIASLNYNWKGILNINN